MVQAGRGRTAIATNRRQPRHEDARLESIRESLVESASLRPVIREAETCCQLRAVDWPDGSASAEVVRPGSSAIIDLASGERSESAVLFNEYGYQKHHHHHNRKQLLLDPVGLLPLQAVTHHSNCSSLAANSEAQRHSGVTGDSNETIQQQQQHQQVKSFGCPCRSPWSPVADERQQSERRPLVVAGDDDENECFEGLQSPAINSCTRVYKGHMQQQSRRKLLAECCRESVTCRACLQSAESNPNHTSRSQVEQERRKSGEQKTTKSNNNNNNDEDSDNQTPPSSPIGSVFSGELKLSLTQSEQELVACNKLLLSSSDCSSAVKGSRKKQLDTINITNQTSLESEWAANSFSIPPSSQPMDWKGIARRYGRLYKANEGSKGRVYSRLRQSCFCNLIVSSLFALFPFFTSFKNYRLPGDLISDLMTGFTIAVLHIPQGMAYGLLAGVDPIYGLYVSFVPVLVMAMMSKSRHVSYGTFAVISMLLANASESVNSLLRTQLAEAGQVAATTIGNKSGLEVSSVVITNNHGDKQLNLHGPSQAVEINDKELGFQMNFYQPKNSTSSLSNQIPAMNKIWPVEVGLPITSTIVDGFIMPTNIEILGCICLVVGLIQMFMALVRLGILSLMFSDQLVSSFTTASAIHVVSSQLAPLFDLEMPVIHEGLFKIFRQWWTFVEKITDGNNLNYYTVLLTLLSLSFLLTIKELIEPKLRLHFKSLTYLPSELILMAVVLVSSWYWQFNNQYGIRIIGMVPTGLPAFEVPRTDLVPFVINDSITVALVSFAMNLSLAQVYAKRYRYSMDPNQELFALGTSNLVGSFFSCFPCASSLSRSAVQSDMNAKSQLCSLFSCAIVISIICYFAPFLQDLPRSTLSCIIIIALKGILIQIRDLYDNWRLSKLDALVWMVTFMSVLAVGITYGLVSGIVASLSMIFFRLLTPNHSILGILPGTEIYVDKTAFINCKEIDQVKIFRFNSALCYLNRTMLKNCVQKSLPSIYKSRGFATANHGRQHHQGQDNEIKFLVIDCSALAYCDYSGAATLVDIIEELEEKNVNVYLAACPMKLISMIEKMQKKKVLERNVYPTISDAINHTKYMRGLSMVTSSKLQSASISVCTNDNACFQSVLGSEH